MIGKYGDLNKRYLVQQTEVQDGFKVVVEDMQGLRQLLESINEWMTIILAE